MNLPFSPSFFRKMEIYQQLMEFEGQKDVKHLWDGEKAALYWAGSLDHQHLGENIDWNHIKDALVTFKNAGFITSGEKENLSEGGLRSQILKCLIVHQFADRTGNDAHLTALINKNGILAGQIIRETKNLTVLGEYKIWSNIWYLLLGMGVFLLILQIIKTFLEVLKELCL